MSEPSQNLNEDPNQFSGSVHPKTNPFASDLKGEFSSNFGTNTNAVSQIFKEGGDAGQNRNRYIILGAAFLVVVGLGAYFYLSGPSTEEPVAETVGEESTGEELASEGEEGSEAEVDAAGQTDAATTQDGAKQQVAEAAAPVATGPIALTGPENGQTRAYDETSEPAVFTWTGATGGAVYFSRNPQMQPVERKVQVEGNQYAFSNPYPGTWYWQVADSAGAKSEVRSFVVEAPARRNIVLSSPAAGGTVAANGGAITWQGDKMVAFYRIELSNTGTWSAPNYRFASSGTSIQLKDVAPGAYKIRIGGFSEVSGQWEYTNPVDVTVQ